MEKVKNIAHKMANLWRFKDSAVENIPKQIKCALSKLMPQDAPQYARNPLLMQPCSTQSSLNAKVKSLIKQ